MSSNKSNNPSGPILKPEGSRVKNDEQQPKRQSSSPPPMLEGPTIDLGDTELCDPNMFIDLTGTDAETCQSEGGVPFFPPAAPVPTFPSVPSNGVSNTPPRASKRPLGDAAAAALEKGGVERGTIPPPLPNFEPSPVELVCILDSVTNEEKKLALLDYAIGVQAEKKASDAAEGQGVRMGRLSAGEQQKQKLGAAKNLCETIVMIRTRIAEAYERLAAAATGDMERAGHLMSAFESRRGAAKALAKLIRYANALDEQQERKQALVDMITQTELCAALAGDAYHPKEARMMALSAGKLSEGLADMFSDDVEKSLAPGIDPETGWVLPPDYQVAFESASAEVEMRKGVLKILGSENTSTPAVAFAVDPESVDENGPRDSYIEAVAATSPVSSEIESMRRNKLSDAYKRLAKAAVGLHHEREEILQHILASDALTFTEFGIDSVNDRADAAKAAFQICSELSEEAMKREQALRQYLPNLKSNLTSARDHSRLTRLVKTMERIKEDRLKYLNDAAAFAKDAAIGYGTCKCANFRYELYYLKEAAAKYAHLAASYPKGDHESIAKRYDAAIEAIKLRREARGSIPETQWRVEDKKEDTLDFEGLVSWTHHSAIRWGCLADKAHEDHQSVQALEAYSNAVIRFCEYLDINQKSQHPLSDELRVKVAAHGAYFASKAMAVNEHLDSRLDPEGTWSDRHSDFRKAFSTLSAAAVDAAKRAKDNDRISELDALTLDAAVQAEDPELFSEFLRQFV